MKKALVIALAALMLCGCSQRPSAERNGYKRFKVVEWFEDGAIMVDKDTGIAYYRYTYGGAFSMFPLYDEDGNLYRPNGWRDYGE